MPKPPAARGLTLQEDSALRFERLVRNVILMVAVLAAFVSFVALSYVGVRMGLGYAGWVVPVVVDGLAIACSAGIVRSQAAKKPLRTRSSEWVGLMATLSLSVAGNVWHVLETRDAALPPQLAVVFAAAIPLTVAFGIHVYGRAMVDGVSAHVLKDDPDRIHFDLAQIGDERAQQPTRTRTEPRAAAPRTPAQPARTETPAPARTAAPARASEEEERARALFDAEIAQDPFTKPDAAGIHRTAQVSRNVATTRRWVARWWEEHLALTGQPDRAREQLADETPTETRVSGAA